MTESSHAAFFRQHGYCTIELAHPAALVKQRDALLTGLRDMLGNISVTLPDYHNAILDNHGHDRVQIELTRQLRAQPYLHQLLRDNQELFTCLVGADMLAQRAPYLRIVRPGSASDSIGYHRDTFYGGSPYEISLVIPFVDLVAANTLRVQPNSHTIPEADIPLTQTVSATVQKGSAKHQLGFLYAPKIIDPAFPLQMQPLPLRFGQVLAFSLATLHGTTDNASTITRWSSDLRIVNSYIPLDLSARPTYYQPLLQSPATDIAQAYLNSN
ncbi:MAG: phytanoyl-CoA dioxygenase family protein [Candidatus Andersenbacteria bacterium]|nr:phytanoyl-CoA dioxygenase family protein [Candidatus Andersenbacteria bacterium]